MPLGYMYVAEVQCICRAGRQETVTTAHEQVADISFFVRLGLSVFESFAQYLILFIVQTVLE